MNFLIKVDKIIEGIQTTICIVFFVFIITLGTFQIFGRYIFSFSLPWTEEVMRFCSIWLAMIGSSLTVRVDGHVSVDILLGFMSDNKKKAILFVVSRLVCVVFLIFYFPAAIELVIKSETSRATSIPLPYIYVYGAVPVGIVMMLLSYASAIPRYAKKYLKGK